tara:strand:+ start:465 stop:719 length:255 start_codon:yes stop_codon:yes gene_type:complete
MASKYAEMEQLDEYKKNKERKYKKGENSKIQKILDKLDQLETLMLRLIKAFHLPPALDRSEISFIGDSSDEENSHPFLSRNYNK